MLYMNMDEKEEDLYSTQGRYIKPVLTSMNCGNYENLGTLKQLTFSYKCFNRDQLEICENLYIYSRDEYFLAYLWQQSMLYIPLN